MTQKSAHAAPDFTLKDGNGDEWRLSANAAKSSFCFSIPVTKPRSALGRCAPSEIVGKTTRQPALKWWEFQLTRLNRTRSLPNITNSLCGLLSDPSAKVANLYGARSLIPGKVARSVFVIDANGVMRYRDVRPLGLFRPKDDEVT